MKNLIIIHNSVNISPLYPFFKELAGSRIALSLYSNDQSLARQFKEFGGAVKDLPLFSRSKNDRQEFVRFLLFPLDFFLAIFWLLSVVRKKEQPRLLCFCQSREPVLIFCARILKLKLIVYRRPDNGRTAAVLSAWERIFSRWGNYWALSAAEKEKLSGRLSKKARIFVLPLGLRPEANEQDDIFCRLANVHREQSNKKFFTVGTAAADDDNYLENLLNAAKNCLNVINELQLIIICDQKSKNKIHWLAKKLAIDPLVWFVSRETMKRKWCSSLDAYIAPDRKFSLLSLYHILSAQANRLPVIAPDNESNRGFIRDGESGYLIEMGDSENISQAIISIYRNRRAGKSLGEKAFAAVKEEHSLEKMIEGFEEMLEG